MVKTKYTPDIPGRIREWGASGDYQQGLTQAEIAAKLGVSLRTIATWMTRHADFLQALMDVKAIVDGQVVQSLFNRAIGYEYTETKEVYEGDVLVRREVMKKVVPPDVAAAMSWLTNRDPEHWQHRSRQEHTGPGGAPLAIQAIALSDDEIEKRAREILERRRRLTD